MASSSVSQDDIEHDFEKNSRRSRIRTARARQINPSQNTNKNPSEVLPLSCGYEASASQASQALGDELDAYFDHVNVNVAAASAALAAAAGVADSADIGAAGGASPKTSNPPPPKNVLPKEKRQSTKMLSLLHGHPTAKAKAGIGRDRRKLREKRRSAGVVHVASTESAGGSSTTADDDESSDAAVIINSKDTLPSTSSPQQQQQQQQQVESGKPSSIPCPQLPPPQVRRSSYAKDNREDIELDEDDDEILDDDDDVEDDEKCRDGDDETDAEQRKRKPKEIHQGPLIPSSTKEQHRQIISGSGKHHSPIRKKSSSHISRNIKPPKHPLTSDMEADDENDHDSLIPSSTSASEASMANIGLSGQQQPQQAQPTIIEMTVAPTPVNPSALIGAGCKPKQQHASGSNSHTPIVRPATPTGEYEKSESISRILEENRKLMQLMEEKDRRITNLENQIQMLMQDRQK